MTKIKPLTLEVEEDIWTKFKESVPRTITLSQAIEDLIKKELEKKEGDTDGESKL